MKKYIFFLLFAPWVCSFYSCSEDPVIFNPFLQNSSDATTDQVLYFSPSYLEASSSSPFTIEIDVSEGVTNLIGAEIAFTFDTGLVSFVDARKGSFFSSSNDQLITDDSTPGTVLLTLAAFGLDDGLGATRSGPLVEIDFTPVGQGGYFELEFSDESVFFNNSEPMIEKDFLYVNATIFVIE